MRLLYLAAALLLPPCHAWTSTPWLLKKLASAAIVASTSMPIDQELLKQVQPATADMPQIVLPADAVPAKKQPMVQGLIYLRDPSVQPDPSDTLVITVSNYNSPKDVFAGAKFSLSSHRLPLSFLMNERNLLKGQQLPSSDNDLSVQARVCPKTSVPCSDDQATFKANGIAKRLDNLPGLPDGTSLRAAASLGLVETGTGKSP